MAIITATTKFVPVGYDSSRSVYYDDIVNPSRFLDDADSENYATVYLVRGVSAETFFYLKFDFSSIPVNASITSVVARTKGRCSGNSNRLSFRQVRGYIGDTAKGYSINLTASDQTITLDLGNGGFTRESLQDFMIRWYAKRSSNSSQANYSLYFYIYGADVTVTYEYDDGSSTGSGVSTKENGVWNEASAVYKKVSGSWVQQTDTQNIFTDGVYKKTDGTIYINGNN